jgi:hypothetical protein
MKESKALIDKEIKLQYLIEVLSINLYLQEYIRCNIPLD